MHRIPAFLLFFLWGITASAQSSITGKVVRADNGSPMAGVSVFISNTSRGTSTDTEGQFSLHNIPPGQYDLVISSVGFETNVHQFSSTQLPLKLRVEMQVKVQELANVTVEPAVEEGWDKWGQLFTESFLGSTPQAEECRILNKEKIKFRHFRKGKRIIAYCDEPLKIENRALGYRITYQLEEFEVLFSESATRYMGYALFEDMDGNRKEVRKRWRRSRDQAFYGSMLHFWRSVFANRLMEDGFRVKRMWRTPNVEKERVREIYRSRRNVQLLSGGVKLVTGPEGKVDSVSADSSRYYEKVMQQRDYFEHFSDSLQTADSILHSRGTHYVNIYFPNYLAITYLHALEDPGYLRYYGESRPPTYQHSRILLTEPMALAVFPDGSYFPPNILYTLSYWAWGDKVANLLPFDFAPFDGPPKLKR